MVKKIYCSCIISGPLTRDELCEILTKGDEQNHDRLTEEDLIYVFQELSIHEDQLIDEEGLISLFYTLYFFQYEPCKQYLPRSALSCLHRLT